MKSHAMDMHGHSPGMVVRSLIIGLTAFLTVVDLFATQATLPSLTRHYNVTLAAMGFAVNASTMGMAVAGLVVGFSAAYRPTSQHSCKSRFARDPHHTAGERASSWSPNQASRPPGRLFTSKLQISSGPFFVA